MGGREEEEEEGADTGLPCCWRWRVRRGGEGGPFFLFPVAANAEESSNIWETECRLGVFLFFFSRWRKEVIAAWREIAFDFSVFCLFFCVCVLSFYPVSVTHAVVFFFVCVTCVSFWIFFPLSPKLRKTKKKNVEFILSALLLLLLGTNYLRVQ